MFFRIYFYVVWKTFVIFTLLLCYLKCTSISVKISLLLYFNFQSAATYIKIPFALVPSSPLGTHINTAFLLSEKIYPLALSSKGKTKGLSNKLIQFLMEWLITLFWTLLANGLKISTEFSGLLPWGAAW